MGDLDAIATCILANPKVRAHWHFRAEGADFDALLTRRDLFSRCILSLSQGEHPVTISRDEKSMLLQNYRVKSLISRPKIVTSPIDMLDHISMFCGIHDRLRNVEYFDIPSDSPMLEWIQFAARIHYMAHVLLHSCLRYELKGFLEEGRSNPTPETPGDDFVFLNQILPSFGDNVINKWEDVDLVKCLQLAQKRLNEVAGIFSRAPGTIDMWSVMEDLKRT